MKKSHEEKRRKTVNEHDKMFHIFSDQGNAYANHNVVTFHTHQIGKTFKS